MRRFTLLCSALTLMAIGSKAQTVATFETLPLASADTYYVNFSASGTDVGFNNGLAHFPCVYDTSYGGFWDYGFAYSNMTDTTTSGYTNGYSSKNGTGYGGSAKYAVAYGINNTLSLQGVALGQPVEGFYVTNNTYAYNDMRAGGSYSKKFGGTTGNDADWFKFTVKGYRAGALTADSVEFYLADFRPAGTANDSIIKGWHWVNLLPLGKVDSLHFNLSSTDNDSTYGMNTPAYFCIDNFTTHESAVGVHQVQAYSAKVYPNPAQNELFVDVNTNELQLATIVDVKGNVVSTTSLSTGHTVINTATLATGTYFLQLTGVNNNASVRFIKN